MISFARGRSVNRWDQSVNGRKVDESYAQSEIMLTKLFLGKMYLVVVCACGLQVGLSEDVKDRYLLFVLVSLVELGLLSLSTEDFRQG